MPSTSMRTAARLLVVLAILGGVAAAGWHLTRPDPIAVALHTVATGQVEKTVANTRVGTVKACRRAYLAPMAAGQVVTLAAREGDVVQAGQILLEIWNDDHEAELRLAEAEAVAAAARVQEACVAAAGADREAARQRKLVKDRMVSEESTDLAQTNAQVRRANCTAVGASRDVAQARVAAAQALLERTVVRAPFAGIVAEMNAELGGYVTPSPPGIPTLPAVDLIDTSCLYVSAPIDEVDAPQIRLGQRACVSLDAFAERRCNGVVHRIAPYVLDTEKQARTVEVEVELRDPADLADLLPGYSADIEVLLETRENVLRVPTEAVLDGDRVLVYADGRLAARAIETGLRNWNWTEVRTGLAAGDRIVTSVGREGVGDGAVVVPEGAAPAAP